MVAPLRPRLRRLGVTRQTLYNWMRRFDAGGGLRAPGTGRGRSKGTGASAGRWRGGHVAVEEPRADGLGDVGRENRVFAVEVGDGPRDAQDLVVGRYREPQPLLNDGSVKCWGLNGHGQLGLGEELPVRGDDPADMGHNLPAVNLGSGKTATALAAGGWHTCALLNDGSVKCWGQNLEHRTG